MKTQFKSSRPLLTCPWFFLGLLVVAVIAAAPVPGAEERPALQISPSILLSWQESVAGSQVVVAADSLDGPWVPCLEPNFRRWNQIAVAVPVSGLRRFYQLSEGGWLFESCDEYTGGWTIHSVSGLGRYQMTSTNGALRISAARGEADRWILWPPVRPPFQEGDTEYTDFATSIDILRWDQMTSTSFGHVARAYYKGDDGIYLGVLMFKTNAMTQMALETYGGVTQEGTIKSVPIQVDPAQAHRLVFTGAGPLISLQLFERDRLNEPVASILVTNTAVTHGIPGGLWLNAGFRGSSFDITVDNLVIAGTRP